MRQRLDDDSPTVVDVYKTSLDLRQRFRERCADLGLSRGEVLRDLIEKWLRRTAFRVPTKTRRRK